MNKMNVNDIDWVAKLSSRKFWALLIGFITPLLLAFGFAQSDITQVAAIVAAMGAIVAYIFGESKVDASREQSFGALMEIETEDDGEEEAIQR